MGLEKEEEDKKIAFDLFTSPESFKLFFVAKSGERRRNASNVMLW